MGARLSRFWREASDQAAEWLHLAIVTGPFVWMPGTLLAMTVAAKLGWLTEDTAGTVAWWAVVTCVVLWLPASPLVRLLIALSFEAVRDGAKLAAWIARKVWRS